MALPLCHLCTKHETQFPSVGPNFESTGDYEVLERFLQFGHARFQLARWNGFIESRLQIAG
jgi:hypothetical protein